MNCVTFEAQETDVDRHKISMLTFSLRTPLPLANQEMPKDVRASEVLLCQPAWTPRYEGSYYLMGKEFCHVVKTRSYLNLVPCFATPLTSDFA